MPRTKTKPDRQPRENAAGPAVAQAATNAGEVLTLAEVAAYLRLTEQDVLRLVREQGLPGRGIGEDWRFLKAAVTDWLGTPAAPGAGGFWQTHYGALKDDPYLKDIMREAYRKRGRPEDGEP
jgi:excisionase family DNA binding protein